MRNCTKQTPCSKTGETTERGREEPPIKPSTSSHPLTSAPLLNVVHPPVVDNAKVQEYSSVRGRSFRRILLPLLFDLGCTNTPFSLWNRLEYHGDMKAASPPGGFFYNWQVEQVAFLHIVMLNRWGWPLELALDESVFKCSCDAGETSGTGALACKTSKGCVWRENSAMQGRETLS
ncbi:hypothetical protein BGW36DRAFT_123531 [Talaromyces proteolyticus]|uniref:Uncharacterized protein n=1 Tax=Talaromyces proteolyticus TaxID=1131652 RepID=A0AAD4KY25_9EURO|nr:uncharacterized protein BGW36DRAFT_123531 [Talaromyces proteolyticus]KAH8700136.1 hypothetical protein BGW36DRAFT_123531 [Talaromyces proteolyticus]